MEALLRRLPLPSLALTALLASHALPTALSAQARDSLVIERFDVEATVLTSGQVEVTETLQPHFYGAWNGVLRDLSLRHTDARGRARRLDVDLLSVTDEGGNGLRTETERPNASTRRWRIYVPDAVDATRTVVIRYRVNNGLRFFEEGSQTGPLDELYWNVTGNEWEVPIQRASFRVLLPEGVSATQAAVYTGPEGSQGKDATLSRDGGVVTAETSRRLEPGEGLTVGVGWAPGVVERPSAADRLMGRGLLSLPLALPFVVFAFCLSAWRRYGKDPKSRAITVQYQPPEGLSPAEVGTLVDNSAQMHDVISTLVDLAVRGYLLIEERKEKKLLGLVSDDDYVFHFLRPPSEWNTLAPHEREFLEALHRHVKTETSGSGVGSFLMGAARVMGFTSEDEPSSDAPDEDVPDYGSVELSDLQDSFYKDLPGIIDAVYDHLIAGGHYRRSPKKVKATWTSGGTTMFVVGIGVAVWASQRGLPFVEPLVLGPAVVVSGFIVLFFGLIMPARTVKGARAREHALGFKEFLDRVESDRYRRMITGPEMFERYLPYAMAFKVEKRWAAAFQDMFKEPPNWYRGPHGTTSGSFNTRSFTSSLSRLSTAAGSTMSSSPSGSGGGGSSGGGSGGGGGGGF